MCEVLSEKEKSLRQMWALFPADGWVAQVPSALWLDFLAEKASLVVGLAQMPLPRKWKKLLIRKDNRTSYSWIYSVRDDMKGICIIYNSWIILCNLSFPQQIEAFFHHPNEGKRGGGVDAPFSHRCEQHEQVSREMKNPNLGTTVPQDNLPLGMGLLSSPQMLFRVIPGSNHSCFLSLKFHVIAKNVCFKKFLQPI